MLKKRYFIFCLLSFLAIAALYVFRLGGDKNQFYTNLIYLFPPLLAFGSGIFVSHEYGNGNPHGRALLLISLGLFSWFFGESIWFVLRIILNVDPFPSVADGFYLLGYPLLFAGLVQELKTQKIDLRSMNQFTLYLFVLVSLLFSAGVVYFGIFRAFSPDEGFLTNAIAISYGVGDLMLIIPSLLILKLTVDYGKGRLFGPWMAIFDAFVLTLIADTLFSVYTLQYQRGIFPYNLIDLLWVAAYLCFVYGFLAIAAALKEAQDRLFFSL